MKKLVISIVLMNLLVACASEKPKEEPAPPPAPAAKAAEPAPVVAPEPVAATPAAAVQVDPLNDQTSILTQRSVFYPFDVSAVQEADKPIIMAHAKYLSEHPDRKIRVEGNCDERGSNEYNLALGQRRADGVKKMLVLGGAQASQIETVSYGEEKPRCSDHSESCWSQNRRSDIKY